MRIANVFSVSVDFEATVSADGSPRRTEHSGDNIRQKEQNPCLLLVVAQDEDLQSRRSEYSFSQTLESSVGSLVY